MPTFDHDAPELFDELIDLAGQLLAYFDTMESRIPEYKLKTSQKFLCKTSRKRSRPLTINGRGLKTTQQIRNGKVIDGFSETRGSVLVFVPGWEEINRVHDYFIHHLDLK